MVKRVLALGAVALTIALAITWYAGRDEGARDRNDAGPSEDENGCALGIHASTDFRLEPDDGDDLIVCHYEMQPLGDEASHLLDRSRRLTSRESAEVRAAIRAAPLGEQEFTGCDVAPEDGPGEFFLLFTDDHGSVPFWVHNGVCGDNGVLSVDAEGELVHMLDTAAVLEALGSSYGPLGPPTG